MHTGASTQPAGQSATATKGPKPPGARTQPTCDIWFACDCRTDGAPAQTDLDDPIEDADDPQENPSLVPSHARRALQGGKQGRRKVRNQPLCDATTCAALCLHCLSLRRRVLRTKDCCLENKAWSPNWMDGVLKLRMPTGPQV